jgi:O-antigen/teichoic acid export membrane protein
MARRSGQPFDRVWDPGLQAERTSLSWQRVNLAGLAASLVSARLVVEIHPLIGYTLAVLSSSAAAVLTFVHGRRLVRINAALFAGRPVPDARVYLILLALLVLVAFGGLVLLFSGGSA